MMKSALLPLAGNGRGIKTKFTKPGGVVEKSGENVPPQAAVEVNDKIALPVADDKIASPKTNTPDIPANAQVDKTNDAEAKAGAIDATIKMKELLARFTPKKKASVAEPAPVPDAEAATDGDVVVVDAEPPTIGDEMIPAVKVTAPPPSPDAVDANPTKDTLADISLSSDKNKKSLARLFSLKRKREANSATPSLVEQDREPKLDYQPQVDPAVQSVPQDQGEPSEPSSQSKREGWKRFRLSRDMASAMKVGHVAEATDKAPATTATQQEPSTQPESPAVVAETIDTYVTAPEDPNVTPPTIIDAPVPEKKGFWVHFGRKNPSTTGQAEVTAVSPHSPKSPKREVATASAPAEVEADDAGAEPKPVAWKRLLSIRRKSEDKVTETTEDNTPPEAPVETAPADASVPTQSERPTPVKADSKDEKFFRGLFFRKDSAVATETSSTPVTQVNPATSETDAKNNDSQVGGQPSSPAKKSLSRIFSVQRKASAKPEAASTEELSAQPESSTLPPRAALPEASVPAASEATATEGKAGDRKSSMVNRVWSQLRPNGKNKDEPVATVQPTECPTCSARKRDAVAVAQVDVACGEAVASDIATERVLEQAQPSEVPVDVKADLPKRISSLYHSANEPLAFQSTATAAAPEAEHDVKDTPASSPSEPVMAAPAADASKA